jgi:hypothetical protein
MNYLLKTEFKPAQIIFYLLSKQCTKICTILPRSTLLSTIIPIRYSEPIDTIEALDKSEMPFLLPGKTAPHLLVATDPRPAMQRVFKRSIIFPFAGATVPWTTEMCDKLSWGIRHCTCYCLMFLYFRTAAGKATVIGTNLVKAREINNYHFAKEHVADAFSSFVLPKHSPLKVLHDFKRGD